MKRTTLDDSRLYISILSIRYYLEGRTGVEMVWALTARIARRANRDWESIVFVDMIIIDS
jgi:hypothetical protein